MLSTSVHSRHRASTEVIVDETKGGMRRRSLKVALLYTGVSTCISKGGKGGWGGAHTVTRAVIRKRWRACRRGEEGDILNNTRLF